MLGWSSDVRLAGNGEGPGASEASFKSEMADKETCWGYMAGVFAASRSSLSWKSACCSTMFICGGSG